MVHCPSVATIPCRHCPAGQAPSLTGLEASAAGGKGWGIEPLQRRAKQSAQSVRIGASMQIDAAALAEAASSSGASAASAAGGATAAGVQLRPWTEEERRQGEAGASGQAAAASGLSAAFAQTITQAYARWADAKIWLECAECCLNGGNGVVWKEEQSRMQI